MNPSAPASLSSGAKSRARFWHHRAFLGLALVTVFALASMPSAFALWSISDNSNTPLTIVEPKLGAIVGSGADQKSTKGTVNGPAPEETGAVTSDGYYWHYGLAAQGNDTVKETGFFVWDVPVQPRNSEGGSVITALQTRLGHYTNAYLAGAEVATKVRTGANCATTKAQATTEGAVFSSAVADSGIATVAAKHFTGSALAVAGNNVSTINVCIYVQLAAAVKDAYTFDASNAVTGKITNCNPLDDYPVGSPCYQNTVTATGTGEVSNGQATDTDKWTAMVKSYPTLKKDDLYFYYRPTYATNYCQAVTGTVTPSDWDEEIINVTIPMMIEATNGDVVTGDIWANSERVWGVEISYTDVNDAAHTVRVAKAGSKFTATLTPAAKPGSWMDMWLINATQKRLTNTASFGVNDAPATP